MLFDETRGISAEFGGELKSSVKIGEARQNSSEHGSAWQSTFEHVWARSSSVKLGGDGFFVNASHYLYIFSSLIFDDSILRIKLILIHL